MKVRIEVGLFFWLDQGQDSMLTVEDVCRHRVWDREHGGIRSFACNSKFSVSYAKSRTADIGIAGDSGAPIPGLQFQAFGSSSQHRDISPRCRIGE